MPQGKVVPVKPEGLKEDQKVTEGQMFLAASEGEVASLNININNNQDSFENKDDTLKGTV